MVHLLFYLEIMLCQKVNSNKSKFDYVLFDGSYILTRRAMAMNKYPINKINLGTMLSETIEMIYKFLEDFIISDKSFIVWDKWSPDIKGYYRTKDLSDYKGNRYYHNEQDFEKLKESGASKDELEEYQKKLLINTTKQQVKKFIIDEMPKYGLPSLVFPGYEADDIAKCFCDLYKSTNSVAIVSKDSDWKFLTGDKSMYVDLLTGEKFPEEKVRQTEHIIDDIPIYTFKCLFDSLYGSHNNLQVTIDKKKVNYKVKKYDAVTRTYYGDKSLILPDKLDLYKMNVESFKIKSFPRYDELQTTIKDVVENKGSLKSVDEFNLLATENNFTISGIDYMRFMSNVNKNCYGD